MRARLRPIDPSYRTAPERTRQKAVTSLHGSRVMQCKQKGTRVTCTMRIQSSRQQRRARYDRCIRRSASVSLHPGSPFALALASDFSSFSSSSHCRVTSP